LVDKLMNVLFTDDGSGKLATFFLATYKAAEKSLPIIGSLR